MAESSIVSISQSVFTQAMGSSPQLSRSGTRGLKNHSPTNALADRVTLSPEAQSRSSRRSEDEAGAQGRRKASEALPNDHQITATEQQEIIKLQRRDVEVRAHEQAHLSAAGQHAAGGARYTYEKGPDGKRYAVAGEVPIDLSRESTPEETIDKMQQVAKAALAPVNPSPADRQIAARANSIATQARMELQEKISSQGRKEQRAPYETEESQEGRKVHNSTPSPSLLKQNDHTPFLSHRSTALAAYEQFS